MQGLIKTIKEKPALKRFIHWAIVVPDEARPRIWIRWFVNPFFHKRKKGSKIRNRTRIDVLPFNNFEIGEKSIIEDFSTVNNGVGHVIIGNETLIGMSNVIIGPVQIGSHVIIAQNVVMSGLNHQYENPELPISKQPVSTKQITIEDDCWIAANVVITAGVCIGKHSVVAGGSVVTKDVPPFSVVAGNPAKVIKVFNSTTKNWESTSNRG